MSNIKYDYKSVLDTKTKFNTYNNAILDSMIVIDKELRDMPRILDTPKTKKLYTEIFDYYSDRIEFIKNSDKLFNKRFDTVFAEYTDFDEDIKKMVGESNDK